MTGNGEESAKPAGDGVAGRVAHAVSLHRQGRLAEAEDVYRAALLQDPSQPDALHFLGLLEQQRGRTHEAIRLMRRATEVAPAYANAFSNLGNVLRMIGDLGGAEACYRRAVALDAGHANALSNLGAVLRARGDLGAAEAACRNAIAAAPNHVAAHNNLGNVLRSLKRFDEAVASYYTSIALDPKHPDGPKLLGFALQASGRADEAKEVYRQWLERDPGNAVARHLLAASTGCDVPERAADGYVKDLFASLAGDFDRHLAQLEYRAPELVMAAVVAQIPRASGSLEVLDAGCGTGLCAAALKPYAGALTGVDLSPAMLQHAAQLRLYDDLREEELTAHLEAHHTRYDLIVSADTLCYFGRLRRVLAAAAGAMRPGGLMVFTVEEAVQEAPAGYRLEPHGRYSHSRDYVRATLEAASMRMVGIEAVALRNENGAAVSGLVVVARTREGL